MNHEASSSLGKRAALVRDLLDRSADPQKLLDRANAEIDRKLALTDDPNERSLPLRVGTLLTITASLPSEKTVRNG